MSELCFSHYACQSSMHFVFELRLELSWNPLGGDAMKAHSSMN